MLLGHYTSIQGKFFTSIDVKISLSPFLNSIFASMVFFSSISAQKWECLMLRLSILRLHFTQSFQSGKNLFELPFKISNHLLHSTDLTHCALLSRCEYKFQWGKKKKKIIKLSQTSTTVCIKKKLCILLPPLYFVHDFCFSFPFHFFLWDFSFFWFFFPFNLQKIALGNKTAITEWSFKSQEQQW